MEPDNPALDDFILTLPEAREPRVLFLPTASGDPAPQIEVPAVDALDLKGPDMAVVGPVRAGEPGHAGDLLLSGQRCLAGTKVWWCLYP